MSRRLTAPTANEAVLDEGGRLRGVWFAWVAWTTRILQGREPVRVPEYTVAALPDASEWQASVVCVSDEAGGYVLAWSDGSNWRRATDAAVVS